MPAPEVALSEFAAVVITGGSSGIGKSFIELAANLRPALFFCNLSRREPIIQASQLKLRHITCDLSKSEDVARGLEQVRDFLSREVPQGRILLVNNSGFGAYGFFPEPSTGQQLEMLDLNMRAVVHLSGELLPELKRRGGAIMTIASTAAFQPTPYLAAYGATKAFVLHWSLALNEELRGTQARAIAVCPGPTSSDFFKRAGLKEGSVPDALGQTCEAVVLESLRALGSRRPMVVTGWKNRVMKSVVTRLSKPLAARLAGIALARYRLSRTQP